MTRPLQIVGIDPGSRGAIARLDFNPKGAVVELKVWDMPTLKTVVAGKVRTVLNLEKLNDVAQLCAGADEVWFEDVHSMPSDGPVQAFRFGFNCGAVQMALASASVMFTTTQKYVKPAVWKRAMRLSSDKAASVKMVHAMVPQWAPMFPKSKDGRAEAALLAIYGYMQRGVGV